VNAAVLLALGAGRSTGRQRQRTYQGDTGARRKIENWFVFG